MKVINKLVILLLMFASQAIAGTRVVAYGDSLTAGLGVEKSQAWPALLQELAAQKHDGLKVINAGVSGDTSAGGLRRLGWSLRQPFDVMILELGANDGLRGINVEETRSNLQAIINKVKASYPQIKIIIAGMTLPPNLGADYVADFEDIFVQIAKNNGAHLIPFLLEGVAGVPSLNQQDGIHPTTEGHEIIAKTVWMHLDEVLTLASQHENQQ